MPVQKTGTIIETEIQEHKSANQKDEAEIQNLKEQLKEQQARSEGAGVKSAGGVDFNLSGSSDNRPPVTELEEWSADTPIEKITADITQKKRDFEEKIKYIYNKKNTIINSNTKLTEMIKQLEVTKKDYNSILEQINRYRDKVKAKENELKKLCQKILANLCSKMRHNCFTIGIHLPRPV